MSPRNTAAVLYGIDDLRMVQDWPLKPAPPPGQVCCGVCTGMPGRCHASCMCDWHGRRHVRATGGKRDRAPPAPPPPRRGQAPRHCAAVCCVPPARQTHHPQQVRVAMKAVGICGSDVHFWKHGRIGDFVVNAPMVIGHECAGVVAAVCRARGAATHAAACDTATAVHTHCSARCLLHAHARARARRLGTA
jgi:hypothetical protein